MLMTKRRTLILAASGAWMGLARAHAPPGTAPPSAAERARRVIVSDGERALASGDAQAAAELFERAGSLAHEPDAELGLLRAMMQAGQYRRALGFAAHVAGVHPEESAGPALYAWLLHLGGRTGVAASTLAAALARLPGDPMLLATRALVAMPSPVPPAELLAPPARFAPASPQAPALLPAHAKPVSSGILLPDGRTAVTVAGPLEAATNAWVRDGLGRIVSARVARSAHHAGIAELRLDAALGMDTEPLQLATRDPFSGSPGFAAGYPASRDATPAWPLMRIGFLGAPRAEPGTLALGIDVPQGLRGGAVFDATGAIAGLVAEDGNGGYRIDLASRLREFFTGSGWAQDPGRRPRMAPDEIYERAMPRVVQVLVAA